MKLLRVLSRLMCYPDVELQVAIPELRDVLEAGRSVLPSGVCGQLDNLLDEFESTPLLELQERYVRLFDRGRALSLHMFEHVHGESRDRGQAMVELMNRYHERGYLLDAHELPDYLPLFLEYLSTQDQNEIHEMLGDAAGVIVLLGARLRERDSSYHVLFDVLEAIAGSPEDAADMRRLAAQEGPDKTIVNMDKIWEEEQVTFLANNDPSGGSCTASGQQQSRPTPVKWVENPYRAMNRPN